MGDPRLRLLDATEGAQAERFLAALDSIKPVVIVPPDLPPMAAGAAVALVALLSRVFAHLDVQGSAGVGPNPWGITRTEEALNAFRAVRPRAVTVAPERTVLVTIGMDPSVPQGATVLGVGGGSWTARVGWGCQPLDAEWDDGLPHCLGLHAAVCLAVGELIKCALMPLGMRGLALGGPLVWNLLDHRLEPAGSDRPARPDEAGSDPLRVLLAGAGSVGTSVAGILCLCTGVTGVAVLVDPEDFDPDRNPFRYPALTGTEQGGKAAWASSTLRRAGWAAEPVPAPLASWNSAQPSPGFEGLLVSSVDDVGGRLEVADVLAREVISVGVAGLAFHVQRERLGDGWACPYCEYVAAEPALSRAHLIAEQIGLPVERVIALQLPGAGLTADDLAACVSAGKISGSAAASLAGHRLADLIGRAYAEVELPQQPAQVPGPGAPVPGGVTALAAPHVSWLAGVLTVAELIKTTWGLPTLDRRVDVDLSGVPLGFTRRVRADTSGRCTCASGIRRRWMRKLYGSER